MNERIKLLAEQAKVSVITTKGMEHIVDGCYILSPDKLEKFAQLIIKECANAFETEVDTWKEMSSYQGSIKRQGTKAIKKHFGVEE